MTRAQQRLHLSAWIVLGPLIVAAIVIGTALRPAPVPPPTPETSP